MHQIAGLQRLVKWADAMCTVYDVAMEVRNAILGGGTVLDVMGALLKGVVVGFMVDGMCKTSLGIILKPMMAIFGLGDQVDQIQKALESGTEIDTTQKHPFYVEGRGWCAAVKLEEGDVLRTKDGKTEVVVDIEVEELDKAVTVYNLEVKDSHTYYVSTNEVLVHNTCENHHIASDKSKKVDLLQNIRSCLIWRV